MDATHDHAGDRGATVEVHAPAGFWGKVSGLSVTAQDFFLFVIVILLGILIYLVTKSDADRERRYLGLQMSLAELSKSDNAARTEYATILKALTAMTDEQKVTTFVLTRTQAQREALNLEMPQSLADRQRIGRRRND